eukprot:PhF_6_TR32974/c0_g1_i2/m.48547
MGCLCAKQENVRTSTLPSAPQDGPAQLENTMNSLNSCVVGVDGVVKKVIPPTFRPSVDGTMNQTFGSTFLSRGDTFMTTDGTLSGFVPIHSSEGFTFSKQPGEFEELEEVILPDHVEIDHDATQGEGETTKDLPPQGPETPLWKHSDYLRHLSFHTDVYGGLNVLDLAPKDRKLVIENILRSPLASASLSGVATAVMLVDLSEAYEPDSKTQLKLLQKALKIVGSDHSAPDNQHKLQQLLTTHKIYVSLSNVYGKLNDLIQQHENLQEALLYLQSALEVAITDGAPWGIKSVQIRMINVQLALAHLYALDGKVPNQIEMIKNTLPLINLLYGGGHLELARALHNLGNAYGVLGLYEPQIDRLEHAVEIVKALDCRHPALVDLHRDLSQAYGLWGDECGRLYHLHQ